MKKLFMLIVLVSSTAAASSSQLKEGNRQFKNNNYDKALKLYEDALIDTPYSSVLNFNAGDAAYQMGDFPKAEKYFTEAVQSADLKIKTASHYNLANTYFYQRKWTQAVDAYKQILRIDPTDKDAKYNLGIALRALKNPPPPKQGQGQGKPDPKQGKGGSQDKNQDQKQADSGNQPKPGQMSKEDAERLLSAASMGEKKKSNQKMPKGEVPHPDEDW